jgi:hypothetical protein
MMSKQILCCRIALVAWYDAYWKVTMPYKYVFTSETEENH